VGIERTRSAKAFFEAQRGFLSKALPGENGSIDAAIRAAAFAYADYGSFLENVVLPRSSGAFAVGKPLFEFLLHEGYFLSSTWSTRPSSSARPSPPPTTSRRRSTA
jgi:hypothetical protein